MKLKNIIVSLAVLLVLPACTDEKMIEEVGETGTFSINLSMGEMEVKSSTEANVPAASNERSIGYCFIAVFSKKNNDDNWSNLVWKKTELANNSNGTYQINGLEFPIKTPLKIVVIANPPAELMEGGSQYLSIDSYSSVLDLTTTYTGVLGSNNGDYYTFDPKTLIKFADEDVIFNNTSGEKTIELTQLAAKIHLNLEVEKKEASLPNKPDEETFSFGEYSVEEVISLLSKNLNNVKEADPFQIKLINGALQCRLMSEWRQGDNNDPVIVSAYGDSENGKKYAVLSGAKWCRKSYTPSTLFQLNRIDINNIERTSYLLNPRGKNDSKTLGNVSFTDLRNGGDGIDLSFYSYQKPVYLKNNDQILNVEIQGGVADGYIVEKIEYTLTKGRVYWGNGSGWGQDESLFHPDIEYDKGSASTPVVSVEIETVNDNMNTYSIDINPQSSSMVDNPGIQHGNYYDVKGVLKQSEGVFSIYVSSWNNVDFDVNYN